MDGPKGEKHTQYTHAQTCSSLVAEPLAKDGCVVTALLPDWMTSQMHSYS